MENKRGARRRRLAPNISKYQKKKNEEPPAVVENNEGSAKKNETRMFVIKPDLLKKYGINLKSSEQTPKDSDSPAKHSYENVFKVPNSPKVRSNVSLGENINCSTSAMIPEDLSNLKINDSISTAYDTTQERSQIASLSPIITNILENQNKENYNSDSVYTGCDRNIDRGEDINIISEIVENHNIDNIELDPSPSVEQIENVDTILPLLDVEIINTVNEEILDKIPVEKSFECSENDIVLDVITLEQNPPENNVIFEQNAAPESQKTSLEVSEENISNSITDENINASSEDKNEEPKIRVVNFENTNVKVSNNNSTNSQSDHINTITEYLRKFMKKSQIRKSNPERRHSRSIENRLVEKYNSKENNLVNINESINLADVENVADHRKEIENDNSQTLSLNNETVTPIELEKKSPECQNEVENENEPQTNTELLSDNIECEVPVQIDESNENIDHCDSEISANLLEKDSAVVSKKRDGKTPKGLPPNKIVKTSEIEPPSSEQNTLNVAPKKRGRPRKTLSSTPVCETVPETPSLPSESTPSKRSIRIPKRFLSDDLELTNKTPVNAKSSESDDEFLLPRSKRKGRKRKLVDEENEASDIKNDAGARSESRTDEPSLENSVMSESNFPECKCAVCSETMLLRDFHLHSLKIHNLLAWIEGEEPIDLKNDNVVWKLLEKKLKMNMKLVCVKCGVIRLSARGFMSHLSQCQSPKNDDDEDLKEECQCGVCNENMSLKDFHDHSLNKHNLLAWKTGEKPINYFDELLILKLLNKKLKYDKIIKCDKCDLEDVSVTNFYRHIFDCYKLEESVEDSEIAKCAVCSKSMPVSAFNRHKLHTHNLLAWMEGEEPIDLNNKSLVTCLLQKKLKMKLKLKCYRCDTVKLSALGFFGHMLQCQKSEEEIKATYVKCEKCEKSFFPTSLYSHMITIHGNESNKPEENPLDQSLDGKKRRAAVRANKSFKEIVSSQDRSELISYIKTSAKFYTKPIKTACIMYTCRKRWKQQADSGKPMTCGRFGCHFETVNLHEMEDHYLKNCPELFKGYKCKYCQRVTEDEQEMVDHILSDHRDKIPKHRLATIEKEPEQKPDAEDAEDVDDAEDAEHTEYSDNDQEEDDDDDEYENDNDEVVVRRPKIHSNKRAIDNTFEPGLFNMNDAFYKKYTIPYINKNYTDGILFPNIKCDEIIALSAEEAEKYMPVERESCNIAHVIYTEENKKSMSFEWKKFKIFEAELHNGAATLWTGGSVWSLSWIPGKREENYLTIAPDSRIEERYFANRAFSHPNLIHFWHVGKLSDNVGVCETVPTFDFAIAHDHGMVWDMAWCPSGCDDDCKPNIFDAPMESSMVRMGLLATSCSNGSSYIYAIPHPSCLPKNDPRIYKIKPSIELHFFNEANEKTQARKIAWSKVKGHEIIAVGYTNGFFALFDINTTSSLLRREESGMVHLKPHYYMQPFTEFINGLCFLHNPAEDGPESNDFLLGISSSGGAGIWNSTMRLMKKDLRMSNLAPCFPWPQVVLLAEGFSNPNLSRVPTLTVSTIMSRHAGVGEISLGPSKLFVGIGAVDTSMWNNQATVVSSSGHALIYQILSPLVKSNQSMRRKKYKRMVLTYSRSVPLSGVPIRPDLPAQICALDLRNQPTRPVENFIPDTFTYKDTINTYGLVFYDIPRSPNAKIFTEDFTPSPDPIDRWPLQNYASVAMNPFQTSNSFYACGGRAGHVRIMSMQYFKNK